MFFIKKFAIQLYSVKDSLEENFDNTLKALSDMGYDSVELFGDYCKHYSAEQLRDKLEFYGLDPIAVHIGLDELTENLDYHIDNLTKLGCKMIVCPYVEVKTIEDAEKNGKLLLKIAEQCIINGIEFGYHNHAHEFIKSENENTFFDIMMNIGDPLVLPELDLGWIKQAGFDPEEYIRKYAGRVTHLHIKQLIISDEGYAFVTLNNKNGAVDCEKCIKSASLMGCEYFIVEQDVPCISELEDAKVNIDYLKSLRI